MTIIPSFIDRIQDFEKVKAKMFRSRILFISRIFINTDPIIKTF